jgi:hypothetical protein
MDTSELSLFTTFILKEAVDTKVDFLADKTRVLAMFSSFALEERTPLLHVSPHAQGIFHPFSSGDIVLLWRESSWYRRRGGCEGGCQVLGSHRLLFIRQKMNFGCSACIADQKLSASVHLRSSSCRCSGL